MGEICYIPAYTLLDAITVGFTCYILEANYIINCKWQILDCSTVAFSGRYDK